MYDAWVAYDEHAIATQLSGALRRPAAERTIANKQEAISYAAYRALVDVLPVDSNSVYRDPDNKSTDIETPAGIGNVACAAVLGFRHHDKANQLSARRRATSRVRSAEKPHRVRQGGSRGEKPRKHECEPVNAL